MNRLLSLAFACLFCVVLLFWGTIGHQTIALIAEHHLTPGVKAAVQYYLGEEILSDVSTWADEVRGNPQYRYTAPWHFLNLPLGLSYEQFRQTVPGFNKENIYEALLRCEQTLKDENTSKEQKREALKFLVHLVGDMHQPMYISRAEDKGGNTIQVNYEGKGTNLHALWDSRLIEHQGVGTEQLAAQVDKATPQQIKKWQSEPVMQWIWESYQISTKLYKEVEGMRNRTITDPYYQAHINIINQRMEQAGIRLAGLLNEVFASTHFQTSREPAATTQPQSSTIREVSISEVSGHIGETGTVCAQMYKYPLIVLFRRLLSLLHKKLASIKTTEKLAYFMLPKKHYTPVFFVAATGKQECKWLSMWQQQRERRNLHNCRTCVY